jgi:hypothetical protein
MGGAGAGAALCVELEDGEEDEGQQPQMEEEMVPVVFNSSSGVGVELSGVTAICRNHLRFSGGGRLERISFIHLLFTFHLCP